MKKRKISTPFGWYVVVEEENKIIEISHTTPKPIENDKTSLLLKVEKEIHEYFSGKRKKFTFPISLQGTAFQVKVWNELIQVPYGELRSYGEIAEAIGHPKASRAVGTACNKNPIGLVVPCHRIVAANRRLGGFAYGVEEKIGLLELEGIKI